MGVIVLVVLVGAASAGAVVMRGRAGRERTRITPHLTAGIGGAAAAALLALALQGHWGASLAVVAAAAGGAGICLVTLEAFGLRGAVTFIAGVTLAGVGGAAAILGLSSVALSATVLR